MYAALNLPFGISSRLTIGAPVTNRKAEWVEDSLNPDTITLEADNGTVEGNATNTAFGVVTGTALATNAKIGDLVKNKTRNAGGEVMQITAIASANQYTVTRNYGLSFGAVAGTGSTDHADGDVFEVMPASQEGSSIGSDRTKARVTRYNYTQILDTPIQMSGTMLNTNMYNVASELQHSVMNRTIEVKKRLDYTIINSAASAAPSDSVYGTMAGLIELIEKAGDISTPGSNTDTIDSSTTALTYDALSDVVGNIYDEGNGTGRFLIATNRTEYEVMSLWPEGQMRRNYSGTGQQYGQYVDSIVTKQGITCEAILAPEVPPGILMVLDLNRIELCPMQGRAWNMYVDPVGFNGNDYAQWRMLGEWTIKMHNAGKAHGLMTALADT